MRPLVLLLSIALSTGLSAQRVVHVIVALADNEHQSMMDVQPAFGNGQQPSSNLLWGAGLGMRTHFDWAPEWERQEATKPQVPHILERAVWKHKDSAIYLIADAYDGRNIREATEDLLRYASGSSPQYVSLGGNVIAGGGSADLIAFLGHNGLMDFKLEKPFRAENDRKRQVIILAPLSRGFFANPIRATEADPLLWTTGLIVPEAYTLREALIGWVAGENAEAVRERAAKVYDQYRKTGIANARRLIVTGW